ncbi:MAG: AAA family ATPase [Bryobacteraceae bacterium]|jgi:uncharacterized protein YhaN
MRFEGIHLPAYGPFTDASLDLREGMDRLEVVYGPNEAGKSSLLRAICDFLFGIHPQTRDNFVHAYGSLRIRASVERDGRRLECVRRKANTKSLRAADDEEVVPEELLGWFVPIESRDVFQTMFGLDAERLQQGGEELLKGQSQFGQLLFSAAAGIEGLHGILEKLNDEAEKLFKPRASTATVAKILDRLKESKDRLREAQVSLTDWNKLQEQHENASAESSRLESEILRKQSETERFKRMQMSLGWLRKRTGLREQLRGVENARILRDGFAADHRKAASDLIVKTSEVRDATRRVDDLRKEVDAIVLPDDLLAREQEILGFHQETGRQRKDASDRLRLQTELRQAESEMTHILRSLGEPSDLDRVPDLVVRAADKRSVQDLSATCASLDTELRNGQESLADEKRKQDSARQQLDGLPATRSVASLRTAVRNAVLAEASEVKAHSLLKAAAGESRKMGEDVKALPWPSGVETLENSALPADLLVAEWTGRLDKVERDVEQAEERLRTAQTEVSTLENRLAALLAGRSVPTLSQLAQDRQRRDLGWKAVRGAWLEGDIDSPEAREFLQQQGDGPSLARAYEDSVGKTDDTADRLRAEADQVAKLEQARAAIDGARKDAGARQAELKEAQTRRGRFQAEWEELWAPFQVSAGAPRQMAAWLQRRASILARFRAIAEKETQASDLLAEAETAKRQLRQCLSEMGETGAPSSDSLAGWRSLAEQAVQSQEDLAKQREKLRNRIEASESALATAEARVSKANTGLDDWTQKWAAVMTRLGLPAGMEPSAAQETIRVREELQTHLRTAADRRTRIAGIDRDARRFQEQLHRLLESVASELLSMPELDAVAELHQRLNRAKQQRDLRETKNRDLERERKTLDEAERGRKQAESLLAALAAEAKCENAERLPALIEESACRKDLEKRLQEAEQQLAAIAAGRSIAELEEEAHGVEPDQIPGQLELLDRQMEDSKARLKSAEEKRITLENELKRMEDNSDSCSASADIEAHKAEALEAVEQYIRLQLARIVLQGAVDQYREKTQGDMLKRSSELFSLLTGASFSGLKLDWGDAGNVVLVGVRAHTSENVALDGMSDGTRDQLYLALRLASMELYARDHEPIPFILDDILVKFDNARAIAAIRALAELARHTQVLLFTHHEHLVDLARENLNASQLAISEIACQIGAAKSAVAIS